MLFCGINPGLYTGLGRPPLRAARQPLLADAAPLRASRRDSSSRASSGELLALGLGITNVVARATATAAELSPAELRAGGEALRGTVGARTRRRTSPSWG